MTETRVKFLRSLFEMAWDMKRCDPSRTFGACLRGAWKLMRESKALISRMMARARRNGGRLDFSPSLIRSPIQRSLTGVRYGGALDHQAAYTTSRLGY